MLFRTINFILKKQESCLNPEYVLTYCQSLYVFETKVI